MMAGGIQVLECFRDDDGSDQGKDIAVVVRTLGGKNINAQQVK